MRTKTWIMLAALCCAVESKAQLSVAADLAWPQGDFGDFYSFGVGPGLGYDLNVGDMLAIFGQASYDFMTVKEGDDVSNAFMVPYQVGLKLHFGGDPHGIYAMGLVGGHSLGVKVGDESVSSNLFSWGLGGGFRTKGKLDFAVRYNSISKDSDVEDAKASPYIGLRIGLFLGGGD